MVVRRPPFPQNPQDIPQPVAPVFPPMPTRGRENWFDQFRSVDPTRELRKPRKDLLQWSRRKKGGIGGLFGKLRRKLLEGRQFPTGIPEQFRQLPFGPPSMGRILPNFGMKQKPMVPWDPPQDWRGQPIPARQLGPNVPEGFIPPSGMATMAMVPYWNPTTGETWTASSGGWTAPEGWERGGPPGSGGNQQLIPWGGAQQPPPATVPEFLPNLVTGELERTSPSPMQPLPMQPLPEEMPMPSLTPEEITQQRIDQVSQFEQEPMMGARYVRADSGRPYALPGGYAGGGIAELLRYYGR